MWKSECPNRKRYTTENRRHYFTTKLRIILSVIPIGFSTWTTEGIENLEVEEEEKELPILRS